MKEENRKKNWKIENEEKQQEKLWKIENTINIKIREKLKVWHIYKIYE